MSNDKHTRLGAFFYVRLLFFSFLLSKEKETTWNILISNDDSFTIKKKSIVIAVLYLPFFLEERIFRSFCLIFFLSFFFFFFFFYVYLYLATVKDRMTDTYIYTDL